MTTLSCYPFPLFLEIEFENDQGSTKHRLSSTCVSALCRGQWDGRKRRQSRVLVRDDLWLNCCLSHSTTAGATPPHTQGPKASRTKRKELCNRPRKPISLDWDRRMEGSRKKKGELRNEAGRRRTEKCNTLNLWKKQRSCSLYESTYVWSPIPPLSTCMNLDNLLSLFYSSLSSVIILVS